MKLLLLNLPTEKSVICYFCFNTLGTNLACAVCRETFLASLPTVSAPAEPEPEPPLHTGVYL